MLPLRSPAPLFALALTATLSACSRESTVTERIRASSSQISTLGGEPRQEAERTALPAATPPVARPQTALREAPSAQGAADGYDPRGGGGAPRMMPSRARRPGSLGGAPRYARAPAESIPVAGFQMPAEPGTVPPPPPVAPTQRPMPVGAGGFGGLSDSVGAALPTIDPNGRFATTYRPGRGHLAGFEASLARGEIPADARPLVGDLGSRYAPDMPAPPAAALAWRVDLARAALAPSGGHTHLRIALRSTMQAATARPPMSVHVVLDVSNSMAGDSIVNARRAAQELVNRLEPGDHFSLVAFGGTAAVRVPEGLVGPRRQQILDTIAGLQLEGGTNISEGLTLGYAEAGRGPQAPEWVKLVMLLSDGRPNAGETRGDAIAAMAARAFQTGVQTSSFGLGDDYDGNLMSGVAEQGAGGYYYVRDPQGIAATLTTELESRLQPVAQGVEVRVRLRPDVRLTQTYGARRLDASESAAVRAQEVAVDEQVARRDRIARDRHADVEGGMRFFIPGFARDDRHVILLGIDLPAGVGQRPVATVELRYKDRLTRRNVTDELPVRVRYADSDAASAATLDPSVQRTVQGFDAGETLARASRLVGAGDTTGASALLGERVTLLRAASDVLHEPRLAEDAARLDRLRNLVGGTGPMSQSLVLAMLLNTSAQGMLH
jgi:Ca-activated chloride channel family protein